MYKMIIITIVWRRIESRSFQVVLVIILKAYAM